MTEPKRVILVDDAEEDAEFVRMALARSCPDAALVAFRSGEEALAHLEARAQSGEKYMAHLVLLDLKLPKAGGHTILEALRERFPPGRLPVVTFTSSLEPEDLARAYALGANSYVAKPLVFEAYLDVVEAVLRYWLEVNVADHRGVGGSVA